MGGAILLVGPFVAAVGLVAVFFVMRHRSVQTKSMYSARRQQIERKVRAARQRTLAPTGKHPEGAEAAQQFIPPGMAAKPAAPTATWATPTAAPAPIEPPQPPPPQAWEVGPTVPPPSAPPPFAPPPSGPPPGPPTFAPPEPPLPPPPDSEWTPARVQPVEPFAPPGPEPMSPPVETPMSTSAGGGAAWSIVGESKGVPDEPVTGKKSKKDKHERSGAWQLASGEAPGDESGDDVKGPSSTLAIAQYAVLVVGLVMVLIGVVVMVANSHVT
jgi:hypothetical protein